MSSNSPTGIRMMLPLSGISRLTATVVSLSQIANAARPSIVVCSGKAHLFPGCAAVEQGTTVTAPCSVFLNDTMMTGRRRSEEHTSELQSLMRNSYADFCLQKKKD